MRSLETLRPQLSALSSKDYGAYQSLRGSYSCDYSRDSTCDGFVLHLDHIPKDPYAPPGTGSYRATVRRADAALPDAYWATPLARTALCDYLARQFHAACVRICPGRRGNGSSGVITIAEPGQEILARSSMQVDEETLEARFFVGLPARGRRIDGATAQRMRFDEVPQIVASALFAQSIDLDDLQQHVQTAADATRLRDQLEERGLVAFVADGAILPRRSGVDQRPLNAAEAIALHAPESLRVTLELPGGGAVSGLGIPRGVTLIVGGGYHGKSTLVEALQLGIYDHVPGDGRERCVTVAEAAKVRAASGRSVSSCDLSAFIDNLPRGQDTSCFSTTNASGSTSQAAFIAESIECGARLLLMDEDTCATNLMIRDGRMQRLVARADEPITAFIDVVRQLHRDLGVSTVLVMGCSGDYFEVADTIIQMTEFVPSDVTGDARAIAERMPSPRTPEGHAQLAAPRARIPAAGQLDPRNQHGHFRISAPNAQRLLFGKAEIDLADVEQITEVAQTRAIGRAIDYARRYLEAQLPLREVVSRVVADVDRGGLDTLDARRTGDLAQFSGLHLAAVLNRARDLSMTQE